MRRYISLLPLLMIVFAVNVVTPRIVQAQTCLSHDETLNLPADSSVWVQTSFATSTECNYIIEVTGTYKYKSAASDNADAFYLAEDVCDPAEHGATHCWVGDFTESLNGFGIGTLNGHPRGFWVEGTGIITNGFQSGLFSKEDSFWLQRGATNFAESRTIVYAFVDGLYSPGQGATGYVVRNVVGSNIISTTTAFDGVIERTTPLTSALTSGMRIETLAAYRNAAGSPWPNPRGSGVLRSVGVWYNGPSLGWEVPVEWIESENLTFEPIEDNPAVAGWTSPYPEFNDGYYEMFYPGSGEEWRFRIEDDNHTDNSGSLSVRVYATESSPARVFRRPLEIGDVNSTYDWSDSNGTPDPAGIHCTRVDDALNVVTGYTDCNTVNRIALEHVPNTVLQTSSVANAPVHAVEGGYVLERRALDPFECYDMTIYYADPPYDGNGCLLEIPNWATPSDRAIFIESVLNPIYVVRVKHNDDSEMRYLITNPRVTAGQDIHEACVLGQTIPTRLYSNISALRSMFTDHYLSALPDASHPSIWNLFADIIDTTATAPSGVVVMGYLNFAQDEYEWLGPPFANYGQIILDDYSDPGNSCDTTANFADCVSINPQFFNEGEYWLDGNASVPALWTNPGVILEPGGSIVLPNLTLDPMVEYGASVQIERLDLNPFTSARVEVRIGQSVYTVSSSGPISTQTIPAQVHTATNGLLYDLSLTNTGSDDVKLHYFCLSEGDTQTVNTCLLDNHSFDLGLTGWDTNGAVASTGFVPGAVDLEDGEWVSQSVMLNPGDSGPHQYTIEVEAEFSQSTGGQIVMAWGSTPVTGGGFVAAASGSSTVMRVVSGVLTVSATGTEDLTITAHVPNEAGPPTAGTVTIRRVCILGPYPGQGGGGVIDEPEGCAAIPYPDSPDVQTVLQWHWYQIDRFNRCTFIPRLNDVYKAIVKGFDQLSDQFKFWQQVLYSFSHWMEAKLFPWLAGYLSNIMPGTIIVNEGGECNDLFCFLTSLVDSVIGPIVRLFTDLIQQAANLLFSVISGLLNVFITLIGQAFTLLQVVLQVFFGLIQQFADAEPIPLPGMPDCDATPTAGICVVWWVADNTVFSGPGAAIIPLIVAILYIEYALWVIAEIKGIITRSAEAL